MRFLPLIRAYAFWFFDILKGKPVKKHYYDVKSIVEDAYGENHKKAGHLNKLLKHAVETTRFYSNYKSYNSVLDFPITNKNTIRNNFKAFCSSKFKAKDCYTVSTSGSTGTPFSVLQDVGKQHRNRADNIYFSEQSGYRIGQKLIYLKIWPDKPKRSFFYKTKLKNIYPHSVFELSNGDIEVLLNKLIRSSEKKSFIGYTSALEKICKYLDSVHSGPISCNVVSIIAISETLNTYTKKKMKAYFGITPVSRYSNNENGIIAQQGRADTERFVINDASYHLEIFDMNKDIPIGYGKPGRIVITDLFNYAMPLIRYDTGDVGVINVDENKRPYLESVAGRKLDLIYDTKGNMVPSHISYKLCKYGTYKQFQLVQNGEKEYLIKLNTQEKVDEEKMIKEYSNYFGSDATIKIKYVNEIPLLASGKRKEVLNTYHSKL